MSIYFWIAETMFRIDLSKQKQFYADYYKQKEEEEKQT